MRRRLTFGVALLLVSLLVLAGCAPRAGTSLSESFESDELYVDLPAIVIDFDDAGQASLGGVGVANLGAVAGIDLSALALPAETVNFFTLENIQHIQVVTGPDGLTILVNGLKVPSLTWDEGSLVATADTVRSLGIALPVLDRILPLVQQFGLGISLTFPVADGTEAIALGQVAESASGADADAIVEAVGGAAPRINLPVVYDEQGNFTVGDLTGAEWVALTGVPFDLLQFTPDQIVAIGEAGLTTMALETTPAGLVISVNDQALPTLSWGEGELQNVLSLPVVQGLLSGAGGPLGMDAATVSAAIANLLPVIQASDVNLSIFFPGSEMGN
ncbi:hypothetical protein GC175_11775 [bacterium]|nr:hypothetical protein [bacterium]